VNDQIERSIAVLKKCPILVLLSRPQERYDPYRGYLAGEPFQVRAIDDLWFDVDATEKTVALFSSEPQHVPSDVATALPTQVALERVFGHTQKPTQIVLNPIKAAETYAVPQRSIDFGVDARVCEPLTITRAAFPYVIGGLAIESKQSSSDVAERAERATRSGDLFEACYLGWRARSQKKGQDRIGWTANITALTFLGLSEDALQLFDECPFGALPEPDVQFIAARCRLLLRQFNEARTILHTLTFVDRYASQAWCELARSFLMEDQFDRALEFAEKAAKHDPTYLEAHLVLGLAYRGIAYPSGDVKGLSAALQSFEKVALAGKYNAAEALFHAGIIRLRSGELKAAEDVVRRSLFLRDNGAARDALIRCLARQGEVIEANKEIQLLEKLDNNASLFARQFVEEIEAASAQPGSNVDEHPLNSLLTKSLQEQQHAAREIVSKWKIAVRGVFTDFAALDTFINYYASTGAFSRSLDYGFLADQKPEVIARVFALYLGGLLVDSQGYTWRSGVSEPIVVRAPSGFELPLQSIVFDRLLLGASSDNFSNLEAVLSDSGVSTEVAQAPCYLVPEIRPASTEEINLYKETAERGRALLKSVGIELTETLGDFEQIDRFVDTHFDVKGIVKDEKTLGLVTVDDIVSQIGFYCGTIIGRLTSVTWYSHPEREGVSFTQQSLGQIYPVARMRRRVYLASAAEVGVRFESFALGVAVAVVTEQVKNGTYLDTASIVSALHQILPSFAHFSKEECEGLAGSLLINVETE